jgi:hypothetical protein
MGAIGSALKNAFTPKKKGTGGGIESPTKQSGDSIDGMEDQMRRERRKEVENILRRSQSRST